MCGVGIWILDVWILDVWILAIWSLDVWILDIRILDIRRFRHSESRGSGTLGFWSSSEPDFLEIGRPEALQNPLDMAFLKLRAERRFI